MNSVKDNLIAARALINTPERWRKDSKPYDSGCCAIIATSRAAGVFQGGRDIGSWSALYDALPVSWRRATTPEQHGSKVGFYNDHPDTTHADIMALFDRAIEAQP